MNLNTKGWVGGFVLFASLMLVACGGGGGGSAPETVTILSGKFVDSAVKGLEYSSGGQRGVTDNEGGFKYEKGKKVRFHIGGIDIGETDGNNVLTPVDLVAGATDETHSTVTNIARLLLTLDDDDDPENGVDINEQVRTAAKSYSVNFSQNESDFENDGALQIAIAQLTALTSAGARNLASSLGTQSHLRITLARLEGLHTSTDLQGSWELIALEGSPAGVNASNSIWTFNNDGSYDWFLNLAPYNLQGSGNYNLEGLALFVDGLVSSTVNAASDYPNILLLAFENNTFSFVDDNGDRWTYRKIDPNADTTPPETTINSAPDNPTTQTAASFSFSSSESGSTFECALDGLVYSACSSPRVYSGLANGAHVFRVRATDLAGNTDATAAVHSWTVDTIPPDTIINSSPNHPTNQTLATFSFYATESGASFECDLDGSGFSACTSPVSYNNLTGATHTFRVRATDLAGNADASPASKIWTIDLVLPDTTIVNGPNSLSNTTSAVFDFSSNEAGAGYECSVDGGIYLACSDPKTYVGLSQGAHQLLVRAVDPAGNSDDTPASWNWTIDSIAPQTTIDSGRPSSPTNLTTATFNFSANETATFQCSLDGAAYASCTSPVTYNNLAEGTHTFAVRATDLAANTDLSPDTHNWTVDVTPPVTTIITRPNDPTNSTSATLTFSANESASFECALDGGAYASCSSPSTYNNLAEGTHSLAVRATDLAGNAEQTPVTYGWTIDITPPQTVIDSAPSSLVNTADATFAFSANESATFECALDGGAFAGCTSPLTYNGLAEGAHSFAVRATDLAGNTDQTPATHDWTIDVTPPETALDCAPADPTSADYAKFCFSANEAATFECALDAGDFSTCVSPVDYSSLTEGAHTFEVRAIDAAGNVDATPASYDWVIDLTPPETTIDSGPADPTDITDATFTFSANETTTFECDLDGGGFSSCTSSAVYTGLTENMTHTFQVRAIDTVGHVDVTPASYQWLIQGDSVAPSGTSVVINSSATYAVVLDEVSVRLNATDNRGVTAYLITEHNATDPGNVIPPYLDPLPADSGWVSVAETSSFTTLLTHTLTQAYAMGDTVEICAWFMDAKANISTRLCDTIIYGVDFESSWGNFWYADNGVWEVGGLPTAGPMACHSGTQCAATVLNGDYPDINSDLVSPSITLPTIMADEELQLRFWHWFSFALRTCSTYGCDHDYGRVYIQEETAPGVWSAATQLAQYVGTPADIWTQPMVDLSAYAGKKVRILFGLVNGHGAPVSSGWYIDDVTVDVVQANNTIPYGDGYESGLGDWWVDNGTWQVGGLPTTGPMACHSGSQCAATLLDGDYTNINSDLVSPSITLPTIVAGQVLQLRFWHWFSFALRTCSTYGCDHDYGRVYIQEETASGVWSAGTQIDSYSGTSGGVWTRPLLDLSTYAGKKVRILFGLVNGHGAPVSSGWYIDDIEILKF